MVKKTLEIAAKMTTRQCNPYAILTMLMCFGVVGMLAGITLGGYFAR